MLSYRSWVQPQTLDGLEAHDSVHGVTVHPDQLERRNRIRLLHVHVSASAAGLFAGACEGTCAGVCGSMCLEHMQSLAGMGSISLTRTWTNSRPSTKNLVSCGPGVRNTLGPKIH